MYPIPSGFYGQRLALLVDAARLTCDAINAAPTCQAGRLAPASVTETYDALRNDPDPFGYLEDLDARCGVDVIQARALLVLAYRTPADEFPDHYWTLHSAGTLV